jgi:ABC-2 type transport system ATP-binding protein
LQRNHLGALARAAAIPRVRVDEVLQLVGLAQAGDRQVRTYSLGLRQRLGLAGAHALLVLDEPANGLDPAGVHGLRTSVRHFVDQGGTVRLASHGLAEVAADMNQPPR